MSRDVTQRYQSFRRSIVWGLSLWLLNRLLYTIVTLGLIWDWKSKVKKLLSLSPEVVTFPPSFRHGSWQVALELCYALHSFSRSTAISWFHVGLLMIPSYVCYMILFDLFICCLISFNLIWCYLMNSWCFGIATSDASLQKPVQVSELALYGVRASHGLIFTSDEREMGKGWEKDQNFHMPCLGLKVMLFRLFSDCSDCSKCSGVARLGSRFYVKVEALYEKALRIGRAAAIREVSEGGWTEVTHPSHFDYTLSVLLDMRIAISSYRHNVNCCKLLLAQGLFQRHLKSKSPSTSLSSPFAFLKHHFQGL